MIDREEQVQHVAEIISTGEWSRARALELGQVLGLDADEIRAIAADAARTLAADRGDLQAAREVAHAYAARRRDAARAVHGRQLEIADEARVRAQSEEIDPAVRVRALQTETHARKHAIEAGKLEQTWAEHADKIAGVLAPGGAQVQVNVLQVQAQMEGLMSVIMDALDSEPVAREKVLAAVRAKVEAGQRAPQLRAR